MKRRLAFSILTLLSMGCLGLLLFCLPIVYSIGQVRSEKTVLAQVFECPPVAPLNVQETLPTEISQQMDMIENQVVQLRRLCPKIRIPRNLLSPNELRNKVEKDFFKQYSRQDASDDAVTLVSLGLLKADINLYDLYVDLYSEQVAGYYDDEAKAMYVINQKDFGGLERMTYAHEYTHTLQDQKYDLRGKLNLNDENCKTNNERCSAVTALVEGDAMRSQQEWYSMYGSQADRQQVLEFSQTYKSPVLDAAPEFLKMDFMFPYQAGYEFVHSKLDVGGMQAFDEIYANPPASTEQILHPDRYPVDVPLNMELPDLKPLLGKDWRQLDREMLGEWYTFLTLAYGNEAKTRLSLEEARQAVSGWGGDLYLSFQQQSTNRVIFLYRSRWDTPLDADEFWNAMKTYGQNRWGQPNSTIGSSLVWDTLNHEQIIFSRNGQDVIWLSAPDVKLSGMVLDLIPEFKPQKGM